MAIKEFLYNLTQSDRKRTRIITERGKVAEFTIQYETMVFQHLLFEYEAWRPVVRYDTSHGLPHKDMLDLNGQLKEKIWLYNMSYEDALSYAEKDINANWEVYKKNFLVEMQGSLK